MMALWLLPDPPPPSPPAEGGPFPLPSRLPHHFIFQNPPTASCDWVCRLLGPLGDGRAVKPGKPVDRRLLLRPVLDLSKDVCSSGSELSKAGGGGAVDALGGRD
jgi:hypothetical protein